MVTWFSSLGRDLAPLKDPGVLMGQVPVTRRVVVVILLGQAVGGLVGLRVHPFADSVKDLWAGAVLATVPALGIGLCWELADPTRRQKSPRAIRLLYILTVFALLLIGLANLALWHLAANNRWSGP